MEEIHFWKVPLRAAVNVVMPARKSINQSTFVYVMNISKANYMLTVITSNALAVLAKQKI